MNSLFCSVVIGSYNRLSFLQIAINSVRKEQDAFLGKLEIIVVDGGSDDGTLEWLAAQKDIITIIQHNRGEWLGKKIVQRPWGYFMNLGFKCAQGKYVCMLSDDSILVPGALINGFNQFEQLLAEGKKIGAIAFYWRHWPEETLYRVGEPMGTTMYVNHGLYLNQALKEVGYIDEENYKFYFADIDLSFKFWQAGYICVDAENSYVEHYVHANIAVRKNNEEKTEQDGKVFMARWQPVFPALTNRNLGEKRTKAFQDLSGTAKQLRTLYGATVVKNPKLIMSAVKQSKLVTALLRYPKGMVRQMVRFFGR